MRGHRVRDATRKECHVCARRRDGEPAGSPKNRRRDLLTHPPLAAEQLSSRWNTLRAHGATNKSHHVCARRRDSEAAGAVSGRERRRCRQIVCRSRMALLGQTPS